MATQFSSHQEHYPARGSGAPAPGVHKKAATAVVYFGVIGGVNSTIAVQGLAGALIASQASALNADDVIINAAIAYVVTLGGGSVFIDQGTYNLAASVITTGPLFLYGAGPDTILDGGANAHAISINNQQYVTVAWLAVQTTPGGITVFNGVNILGGSADIHIFEIYIFQSDNDGIAITNAESDININKVTMLLIDGYGINSAGDNCEFIGNRISNTGNDGIWLQAGGTNNIVLGNRIRGWAGEAIDNDDPSNEVAHNQLIV